MLRSNECAGTNVCDECFQRMPPANVFDDYLITELELCIMNYEVGIKP